MTGDELIELLRESGTGESKLDEANRYLDQHPDADAEELTLAMHEQKLWPEGTVDKAMAYQMGGEGEEPEEARSARRPARQSGPDDSDPPSPHRSRYLTDERAGVREKAVVVNPVYQAKVRSHLNELRQRGAQKRAEMEAEQGGEAEAIMQDFPPHRVYSDDMNRPLMREAGETGEDANLGLGRQAADAFRQKEAIRAKHENTPQGADQPPLPPKDKAEQQAQQKQADASAPKGGEAPKTTTPVKSDKGK